MGLLSNRVDKSSLKPGDHIYSWRTAYIYAHHGIYMGDDKVIHFTTRGQELGSGTVLDALLVSSCPNQSHIPCPTCTLSEEGHGVVSSCLNCFLAGGILYRFEYAVNPALFLAKVRGGTCTLAGSDPDDIVIHRANYLLNSGFGGYNVFKNNCEDFAIYCKTELLVLDQSKMGQSGQAVAIIGGPLAAVLSTPLRLVTTNFYGMAATAVGVYCARRYAADIGRRTDVEKVSVEDLARRLATGNESFTKYLILSIAKFPTTTMKQLISLLRNGQSQPISDLTRSLVTGWGSNPSQSFTKYLILTIAEFHTPIIKKFISLLQNGRSQPIHRVLLSRSSIYSFVTAIPDVMYSFSMYLVPEEIARAILCVLSQIVDEPSSRFGTRPKFSLFPIW